ncbi:response regulator [Omnitrophica bacterium]|nr:response regulator [Candidatus Omnitrophota bacterium]
MAKEQKIRGTILIVDDEPNVVWFISKVCQPRGFATLTAASGLDALKMVQECGKKIDLVLLDLRMPGMGGLEVLESIRRHHPELPVIILTALHDKKAECEKLGIEAFMKKPYSLEDLYEKIEQVVDRKTADAEAVHLGPDVKPVARIMIVDDDTEVCELLSEALFEDIADAHFTVKWAPSGVDAIRLSTEFKPDIALVDIKMEKMWGDELIRRFKNGEGYCPRDFVIYTSLDNPEDIERAKKAGHKFLSNPTDLDALYEVLKKICMKHGLLEKK